MDRRDCRVARDRRAIGWSQSFKLTFWLAARRYYQSKQAGQKPTDWLRLARFARQPSLTPFYAVLPRLERRVWVIVWSQVVRQDKTDLCPIAKMLSDIRVWCDYRLQCYRCRISDGGLDISVSSPPARGRHCALHSASLSLFLHVQTELVSQERSAWSFDG